MKAVLRVVVLTIVVLTMVGCGTKQPKIGLPQVEHVDRYSAIIVWRTNTEMRDQIFYRAEGEAEKSIREGAKTQIHRITLAGLLPDRIYRYRIMRHSQQEFYFRTAPNPTASFRFCIIANRSYRQGPLLAQMYPDFFIFLGQDTASLVRWYTNLAEIHTRVPFFVPPFSFPWANSYLDWAAESNQRRVDPMQNENVFLFGTQSLELALDEWASQKTDGEKATAFIASGDSLAVERAGYARQVHVAGNNLLVEVQGLDVTVTPIQKSGLTSQTLVVREAPLRYQKTCVYCRRLLEDKRYHESIAWYRRFMQENQGRARLDDAQYQIAYIYDHYLFDYGQAVVEYQALLDRFPNSKESRPAQFRLQYIASHASHQFKPLRVLEKARRFDLQQRGMDAVREVQNMLKQYPHASIREETLYWLGTVLPSYDHVLAIEHLSALARETVDHDLKWKAMMAIGDLHYGSGAFRAASVVYRGLQAEFPGKANALDVKVFRCRRNQWRRRLGALCAVFVLGLIFGVATAKPRGLSRSSFIMGLGAIAAYFICGCISVAVWYDYLKPAIPFAAATGLCLFLSAVIIAELGHKLQVRGIQPWKRTLITALTAWVLTGCSLYLLLYGFHYLFVVERLLLGRA